MPDLIIRIKKKTDGSSALSCQRADGSVTWQRNEGRTGVFFPLHDLTHFAVESVLGLPQAFYGLLADGWNISSFEEPGASERIPDEGHLAELIVGLLDLERASGIAATADDFNDRIRSFYADRDWPRPSFVMTEDRLARIREVRDSLFLRWRGVLEGETLELHFKCAAGDEES